MDIPHEGLSPEARGEESVGGPRAVTWLGESGGASPSPALPGASELKPCPFCGSEATVSDRAPSPDGRTMYWAFCFKRGCHGNHSSYSDREDAIAAWNRRVAPLEPSAEPEVIEAEQIERGARAITATIADPVAYACAEHRAQDIGTLQGCDACLSVVAAAVLRAAL